MSLYTRTGDQGDTGLFGAGRVSKASPRVGAYGDVDELNACIGLVRATALWPELDAELKRVQNELFDLGSRLASTPEAAKQYKLATICDADIKCLEDEIDRASATAPELKNFVLPGGSEAAARLHLARCVCRRVERHVVQLAAIEDVEENLIVYLNRLSDLLFAWAREANVRAGKAETLWTKREA